MGISTFSWGVLGVQFSHKWILPELVGSNRMVVAVVCPELHTQVEIPQFHAQQLVPAAAQRYQWRLLWSPASQASKVSGNRADMGYVRKILHETSGNYFIVHQILSKSIF